MDKEEIERLLNTPSDMRSCKHVGLSDKVALFNKKADQHVDTQTKNPFSAAEGVTIDKPKLDKNDPNYGRPVAGSKTDIRGKRAYTHISKEVLQLCQIIYENGVPIEEITEDGHNQIVITFGELFQIYTSISNKVVGVLLRARKHKFLDFEGETLFQRRDDDVPIILRKSLPEIGAIFQDQMEKVAQGCLSDN
ncbi:actin-binding Rho-activating protein-like isoform X1 [Zootermopsis nevadensis]|uniref:Actin-binding Rho-activating protein n=1 Tax=Zootermopsis nevadensis TaxID=136037 RepID=A0A067QNP8_ZOONE|nr:actin-binding Rho-activating protein-like isoform X1 [Zootermopsis nevadensis]KDR10029.1 Actin-binding Rho-activating protein [Zootermopsis nevadensis]